MNWLTLLKFWREGSIALLLFGFSSVCMLYKNEVNTRQSTIETLKKTHELALAKSRANFERQSRQIEQKKYDEVINAIQNAEKRRKQIRVDVHTANNANQRLHKTLDKLNTSIAKENAKARADYTLAVANLFKDCTANYIEMAKTADGHANDVRLMQDAWGD